MKKTKWSRRRRHSDEEQKAIAAESTREPDAVVSKRHGITNSSLTRYRKKHGIEKPREARGKAKSRGKGAKKRNGSRKRPAPQQRAQRTLVSNGHNDGVQISAGGTGLDAVERDLHKALDRLRTFRQALRAAFGGEG